MSKVRLFIDHPLGPGQAVPLNADQAHYLSGVMRLPAGTAAEASSAAARSPFSTCEDLRHHWE